MAFSRAGQWGPEGIIDKAGRAQPLAAAALFLTDHTTPAVRYTDATKATVATAPLAADTAGNMVLFADPGRYRLVVTIDGVATPLDIEVPVDPDEIATGFAAEAAARVDGDSAIAASVSSEATTARAAEATETTARLVQVSATRVDVHEKYGVICDGTDRSTQWDAAIAAEFPGGVPGGVVFALRPGTLVLDDRVVGPDTAIGSGKYLTVEGVPGSTWLQAANANRKALTITGDSRIPSTHFTMKGVGLDIPADRPYSVPVLRLEQCRNWLLERCRQRANGRTGLFVQFDGSYEGAWRDSYNYGDKFAVPFEFLDSMLQPNAGTGNPPQADTVKFDRWTNNGSMGGIFRDGGNEVHGLLFEVFKVVSSTNYPTPPRVETVLAASAAAGASSLQLVTTDVITGQPIALGRTDSASYGTAARSGIIVGDAVEIDWGGRFEHNKIAGYNAGTGVVTLAQPLCFRHDLVADAAVIPVRVTGGMGLVFGANIHNVHADTCHFEHLGAAFDLGAVEVFESDNVYTSCHEHVRISDAAKYVTVRQPSAVGSTCENATFYRPNNYNTQSNDNYPRIDGVVRAPGNVAVNPSSRLYVNNTGATGAMGSKDHRESKTINGHLVEWMNAGSSAGALVSVLSYAHAASRSGRTNPYAGTTYNGRVVATEALTARIKHASGVGAVTASDLYDGTMTDPDGNPLALIMFTLDDSTGQFLLWASQDGGTTWKSVELTA